MMTLRKQPLSNEHCTSGITMSKKKKEKKGKMETRNRKWQSNNYNYVHTVYKGGQKCPLL